MIVLHQLEMDSVMIKIIIQDAILTVVTAVAMMWTLHIVLTVFAMKSIQEE